MPNPAQNITLATNALALSNRPPQASRLTAADLAARIPGARRFGPQWRSKAPCHGSKALSLSWKDGDHGGIAIHCHANCAFLTVLRSLNLTMRDVSPERGAWQRTATRRREPTHDEIRTALEREALTYRRAYLVDNAERLVASDLNTIRRTVAARLGIALPPIERRASDSHAAGHERDPMWAMLLERAWFELWIERTGAPADFGFEDFARLGRAGISALIASEERAAAEIRNLVTRAAARDSRGAA